MACSFADDVSPQYPCHRLHSRLIGASGLRWSHVGRHSLPSCASSHGAHCSSPVECCPLPWYQGTHRPPNLALSTCLTSPPLAPPDANKQLALQHMPQSGVATVAQAMRNAYESRVPFDSLVGVLTNAAGCLRALVEDNRKPQLCPAPWAQHLTCEPTHKLQPWRCKKQWTVAFSRSLLAA